MLNSLWLFVILGITYTQHTLGMGSLSDNLIDDARNGTLTATKLQLYKSHNVDFHASEDYVLQVACWHKHYATVKLMIDNVGCQHVQKCLAAAARGGNVRIIDIFLQLGGDANGLCGFLNNTYILWEAVAGKHADAVTFLLERGAALHAHDNAITPHSYNQETLLGYAIAHGDHKTTQALLDWSCKEGVGLFPATMISTLIDTAHDAAQIACQEDFTVDCVWQLLCCPCICCCMTKRMKNVNKAVKALHKYLKYLEIHAIIA